MDSVKLIRWQAPMVRVLVALIPLIVSAVYFFGWRVIVMLAAVNLAGFAVEYAFTRQWKEPVSSAVFVSGCLFTLSLPPTLPIWMCMVGIVFGILFGKMVFGGFGRNVFNPALTGRAFLYVGFANTMTSMWAEPVAGSLGGLGRYASDAITQATPGMLLKTGAHFPISDLFFGNIAGTIGGTSALWAIAGGVYILWTKAANYRIVVSGLLGFLILQSALWLAGVKGAADPVRAMLGGSFVVGIFFYATDPVSASQTHIGRWLYGAFIGALSCLIACYSTWPAGTMFAILLANMFAPITDHVIKSLGRPASAAPRPEE